MQHFEDCFYGRVGFDFYLENFLSILSGIEAQLVTRSISKILILHSGQEVATIFAEQALKYFNKQAINTE